MDGSPVQCSIAWYHSLQLAYLSISDVFISHSASALKVNIQAT